MPAIMCSWVFGVPYTMPLGIELPSFAFNHRPIALDDERSVPELPREHSAHIVLQFFLAACRRAISI
jgi:hypothetical protein